MAKRHNRTAEESKNPKHKPSRVERQPDRLHVISVDGVARIPRGEPPYGYEQCKREIRKHIDDVLHWYPYPNGNVDHRLRREQAEADVLAQALETIAAFWQGPLDRKQEDEATLRHRDRLLAAYALKQARRLR